MVQLGSTLWLDSRGPDTYFGPVECNLCLPTCFELGKGLQRGLSPARGHRQGRELPFQPLGTPIALSPAAGKNRLHVHRICRILPPISLLL